MGYKYNPLIYAGLDLAGAGTAPPPPPAGDPHWKAPVAFAGLLPSSGNSNGDARITTNDQHIHIWDGSSWIDATSGKDLSPGSYLGNDQASFTNISGFLLPSGTAAFEGLIHIITDDGTTTLQEFVKLNSSRTNAGISRTEERTGDTTDVDFQVVDSGGNMQVQYRTTTATPEVVAIRFRAFTIN